MKHLRGALMVRHLVMALSADLAGRGGLTKPRVPILKSVSFDLNPIRQKRTTGLDRPSPISTRAPKTFSNYRTLSLPGLSLLHRTPAMQEGAITMRREHGQPLPHPFTLSALPPYLQLRY